MENNGKSQSPHVIKIDLDSDSSQPPISRPNTSSASSTSVKNITIGQITDSVIAKDFATSSLLSHRPPYGSLYHHEAQQPPVSMGAPDQQWIRRLPPGVPVSQQQSMPPQQQHSSKDPKEGAGRVPTPDDRQIIRMAQTPSPRAKGGASNMPMHEPVSPPDDISVPAGPPVPLASHYYSSGGQTSISLQPLHGGGGGQQPPPPPPQDRRPNSGPPAPSHNNSGSGPTPTSSHQTNFVLDCYVKNRIVEEMRIQEKGSGDRQAGQQQQQVGQGGQAGGSSSSSNSNNPHDRSSTPGDEEMRPNSRTSAPPLGSAYNSSSSAPSGTTVAYPYSAWNVSGAPPSGNHGPPPPTSVANKVVDHGLNNSNNVVVGGGGSGAPGGGGGGPAEPKPLLSSQYEELSDEDEGNGN